MTKIYSQKSIIRFQHDQFKDMEDDVVIEFPLTLFLNGDEIVTMVCSPQDLTELGVGFLYSEGIINCLPDIADIHQQSEGILQVKISKLVNNSSFLRRNIASCCGKGRAGLYFINDAKQVKRVESSLTLKAKTCLQLINMLEQKSQVYHLTGGVHSAALAYGESFLFFYEDIGRHNTVDKILGTIILQQISTEDKCLVLSGRISSEIVIKAARANLPVIISKAAPTDLAIDLAEDLDISLIGFARDGRLNTYSCAERILME